MESSRPSPERLRLLADVAELYYINGKDQAEIARLVGVTRSMVSRLLSEARQHGIVSIEICRPIQTHPTLQAELVQKFGLSSAQVINSKGDSRQRLLVDLGRAAAQFLTSFLQPDMIVALAWGTSINATVNAIEPKALPGIKVVQLVGAMGARNVEYDGHTLVQRLAEKLQGEAYFIHAPFLCQSPEVAVAVMGTQSIQQTIAMGRHADVALLGVGSTQLEYSSFYLSGYVPQEELEQLQQTGAVGDIAGIHFDREGNFVCDAFYQRLVTIRREDLLRIPERIGVAGGSGKGLAILGALRGRLINHLVTDVQAAQEVLMYCA